MNDVLRTGTAFAATVTVGDALCTLVFWIWPEVAMYFMNGLFHATGRRARENAMTKHAPEEYRHGGAPRERPI